MIIADNDDMKFFLEVLSPPGNCEFKFRTLCIFRKVRYDYEYLFHKIK